MSRLEAHYETVCERNGYDQVAGIDWLSSAGLDRRFVAVDGRETVERALDRETKVCMGVGMTGPPHLGTVGQILTGIELQEVGLDVQFVIADLEPYHGGGDLGRVRRLAERYREFALGLGFDPKQGVLRTQEEGHEVMHTAELLAPYYAPGRWEGDGDGGNGSDSGDDSEEGDDSQETAWTRAVRELYEGGGEESVSDGPTSEAASAHSSVLHGADFLHPLSAQGYEQVIITLGVDEHGLTPRTRRFRDAAPVEGAIAGLHTRMVPGFGDTPKMSKSVGAGVSLEMEPAAIRERFANGRDGGDPASSPTFQTMCLASRYGSEELERLEEVCVEDGEAWSEARREYADYVVDLADRWKQTE